MKKNKWEFWIDRGGTFTDIVACSPEGRVSSHKLLSENPEFYPDATIQGIQDILQCSSIPANQIAFIKMGTTVATNTLLERKGAKVLLAITKGFADALRIGYQNRPDLFALNIKLPSLLYEEVIEIDERVNAQGSVLQPLDEKKARKKMEYAFAQGYCTIAIVLMHAYQYTQHEKKLKEIAREIGFTQISVSHEVASVMKLVSRGDTTVVDAYLSPVLQRYIQSLHDKLGKIPLFFMQSNGGLIHAQRFQGKDSLFSGPAGGVIGMIKTSQLAGFNEVIGFDMGGTSTDVSHFAGEYERSYSYEFSGVHIRTPMMLIHTIAAGGGSILNFDGQRYTVGPQSAGANPGPACYRRGGPLTITDCNVLLGKIQPQFFPKVFGTSANQEIDVLVVKKHFQDLAKQIQQATGSEKTVEHIAESYLNIAVENMANAIKKISVQRGYDVRRHVLNCFGGAAGQHACRVADTLGIKKILIHPLAGVLSAYGMGLAEIGVLHEQAIERPLQRGILSFLRAKFKKIEQRAQKELKAQGLAKKTMICNRQVHLRYEGSDTMLHVLFGTIKSMRQAFIEQHRKTFGFASPRKKLIVEAISIECTISSTTSVTLTEEGTQNRSKQEIPQHEAVKIFTQGSYHEAPVYVREELIPGDCIQGCAVITEANATTIVEPGWHAEMTAQKDLLLTRYQTLAARKINTQVDPAMLEVFNNRFMNIAEQMGEVLRKTASSVNIKERLDFSCAIFDEQGELVANAPHIPVHLGSMSDSVKSILKNNPQMHSNDVYVLNAPYNGGTHLPDITLITPVFDKQGNTLLFLVGSRGHHADIGGITPGSIPAESKTVEEEGVLINNFKIMDQGRFLERATLNLLTKANYPARNPHQNLEDFKAQIAANACGVQGLLDLTAQFGLDVVHAYMGHVRDNATLSVERLLGNLHNGHFTYALDDGSQIKVALNIHRKTKKIRIDFTGSSGQHPGNFNAPTAICKAAVLYVLRCLIAEKIPLNNGCFVPLELLIPEQSILNPSYPAAVVAGNVETSQCIVDTLFGALGVVAASQGTCNNFTFGNKEFQYYETICGGAGAGADFDGASAVHTHMTNTYLTDPEVLEWRFPVLLEEFSIRKGSGGSGLHRGGDGVVRRIRFLEKMIANIISSHRVIPPYGMHGGASGKPGRNWVQRADGRIEDFGSCAQVKMQPGDVFIIETPGGGGYGKL
ncbi:Acetone carboxylase beta subunit [Legionella steigerwaltii]|uniref:Acetone carboxylase beta subunit n=1 Tax=Legionella steigerwaltii TaxID=460 RepID=A0A378LAP1_9GAMM|nr:hydantoinase B/oxoprolinase family protein [Legionella steigerwaltii]KTD75712.1 Acetophenone carboxylase gamma subunit [Legionella steigerwaltii]STY23777.1 Acetone carboxylase beta subunit [Legionella steigerwaltii]